MKSFIQFINEASVYKQKKDYIDGGKKFLEVGKNPSRGAVEFSKGIDKYKKDRIFNDYSVGYGPLIVVSDRDSHDEEITLGDKEDKSIKVKDVQKNKVLMITGPLLASKDYSVDGLVRARRRKSLVVVGRSILLSLRQTS